MKSKKALEKLRILVLLNGNFEIDFLKKEVDKLIKIIEKDLDILDYNEDEVDKSFMEIRDNKLKFWADAYYGLYKKEDIPALIQNLYYYYLLLK